MKKILPKTFTHTSGNWICLCLTFLILFLGKPIFANDKDEAKVKPTDNEEVIKLKNQLQILKLQKQIAEIKAKIEAKELLDKQAKLNLEVQLLKSENDKLQQELALLEVKKQITEKNKTQVAAQFNYTETPLDPNLKNQILKISDRRIALNGPIVGGTAKYVAERIHFFNNRSSEYPIFIVIDNCPGGSVFEGYQIIQSMRASAAPIHVVVKGYAASLAAVILTLAEHSYVYPNAWILHHQVRSQIPESTDVREFQQEQERLLKWAERIHGPVAEKLHYDSVMDFYQAMYRRDSNGDWAEFGDDAVNLNWADEVIYGVAEEGIVDYPDEDSSSLPTPQKQTQKPNANSTTATETAILPRLLPFDFYFIYNADNRYQW